MVQSFPADDSSTMFNKIVWTVWKSKIIVSLFSVRNVKVPSRSTIVPTVGGGGDTTAMQYKDLQACSTCRPWGQFEVKTSFPLAVNGLHFIWRFSSTVAPPQSYLLTGSRLPISSPIHAEMSGCGRENVLPAQLEKFGFQGLSQGHNTKWWGIWTANPLVESPTPERHSRPY